MEDAEREEVVLGLFDVLAAQIQLSLAQKAALNYLSEEAVWGPIVLRVEERIVEHLREEIAELRGTLVSSRHKAGQEPPLPADWKEAVRRLVESAKDVDLLDGKPLPVTPGWTHCVTEIYRSKLDAALDEWGEKGWRLASLTLIPPPAGSGGGEHLFLAVFTKAGAA